MNIEQLEQYAPYVVIFLLFIWQNNVFVRPEELEKKHREILNDIKKDFVELNAYKEFQNHVLQEIAGIKKNIDDNFDDLKNMLAKFWVIDIERINYYAWMAWRRPSDGWRREIHI